MANSKYIAATVKYYLKLFFKYKSNIIFEFFSELAIPMCINIMFVIGAISGTINTNVLIDTIIYIIIANITYTITIANIENTVANEVKMGKLSYKLLEPFPTYGNYILADMANKLIRIILFYIPFLIVIICFNKYDIFNILIAIPFLFIANIIGYCISFTIGCLSFWVTEIWGISAIKNLLISVMAGTIFPFYLLSDKYQSLLLKTPFPFLSYVPSAIVLGEIQGSALLELLFIGIVWSMVSIFVASTIWRCGRSKYECTGV